MVEAVDRDLVIRRRVSEMIESHSVDESTVEVDSIGAAYANFICAEATRHTLHKVPFKDATDNADHESQLMVDRSLVLAIAGLLAEPLRRVEPFRPLGPRPLEPLSISFSNFASDSEPISYPVVRKLYAGVAAHGPLLERLELSRDFAVLIKQYLSWEENYDGLEARPVSVAVGQRVEDLAQAVLPHAGEPEVYPAGDGSLMVDWHLRDGTVVGLFVADADSWEPAAVIRGDSVRSVELHSEDELLDLIEREARRAAGW